MWGNVLKLFPLTPITLYFGAIHLAAALPALTGPAEKARRDADKFRSYALSSLNQYVSESVKTGSQNVDKEGTALIVSGFLAVESMLGHNFDSTAHMNGLFKFMIAFGGAKHFPHIALTHIYMTDCSHSMLCGTKPLFQLDSDWLLDIAQLQVLDDLLDPIELTLLGSGFKTPSLQSLLHSESIIAIHRERQTIVYVELVNRGVLQSQLHDNDLLTVAAHGNVSTFHNDIIQDCRDPGIQKCILLAIQVYHVAFLRRCATFPYVRSPMEALKGLLGDPAVVSEFILPEDELNRLLLWMYWTCWCVSKIGHHPELQIWYAFMFQEMIVKLSLQTWEQVQDELKQFFYIERFAGHIVPDIFK